MTLDELQEMISRKLRDARMGQADAAAAAAITAEERSGNQGAIEWMCGQDFDEADVAKVVALDEAESSIADAIGQRTAAVEARIAATEAAAGMVGVHLELRSLGAAGAVYGNPTERPGGSPAPSGPQPQPVAGDIVPPLFGRAPVRTTDIYMIMYDEGGRRAWILSVRGTEYPILANGNEPRAREAAEEKLQELGIMPTWPYERDAPGADLVWQTMAFNKRHYLISERDVPPRY